MSMSRREREEEVSFPDDCDMPIQVFRGGVFSGMDYYGDSGYDSDFGGFIGRRLRHGYWMLDDSDKGNDEDSCMSNELV